MELFECHKLFFEILRVEFVVGIETKDAIVFQFLLEQLSYLRGG